MREIQVSGGRIALVDDEDYEALNAFSWCITSGYASRHQPHPLVRGKRKRYLLGMHRQIMGLEYGDPRRVDHKNGNKLDNRRENLRICDASQNGCNRGASRANSSGFKGVSWSKVRRKWVASITHHRKMKNLGGFDSREDAAAAYMRAAELLHGEFAYLAGKVL